MGNVIGCGLASGLLMRLGDRSPLFGWVALVPLGFVMLGGSATQAAIAAACAGALASASVVWTPALRSLVVLTTVCSGLGWALAFGAATWVTAAQTPELLSLSLPLAAVLGPLPLRAIGAPRWVNNSLARTQERWLVIVHSARCGGDLATCALLATASAAFALVLAARASPLFLTAMFAVLALCVGLAALALRAAVRRAARARKLRVAAVVSDEPVAESEAALPPIQSESYRDVEATIARYEPLMQRAATEGACLIVLPEVAIHLDATSRPRWFAAVQGWARAHDVAIVCPYFDATLPRNELVVIDARGVVAQYEKQHPGRGLEPPRGRRQAVGPHVVRARGASLRLSTAICVDLDYGDTVRSARRAGALLAAPSNDWFDGFEHLHHRAAVWSAVIAGVPLVRATGHGISSIYDAAGRVLAQQSSQAGSVVLVADIGVPT